MRVLMLTSYSLRRIARRRALVALLAALPIACAAAALLAASFAPCCAWVGPIAFLATTGGVVLWQKCSDEASGLVTAFRCSPMSARGLLVSRVLTVAMICAAQAAAFFAIRAVA